MTRGEPSQTPPAILVVDDTHENLLFLVDMLKHEGYHVRPAPDGQLALNSARADPPDLILLDVMMPGINGYQVCEKLKADARTRDVPVLFLSALNTSEDKVRAFEAGGVDFIGKPFQMSEVLARVRTHLALSSLQKQLACQNEQLQQEITERRRAEEALHHHAQQLEIQNADLDTFAHTVAHDLKNPLSVLVGHVALLEEDLGAMEWDNAYILESIYAIAKTVMKMDSIIDELLLLSRVRQAEFVTLAPLDMQAIVKETLLRIQHLLKEQSVDLHMPSTWPTALGYAPWVEEVWINYLSNAIKYGGSPPQITLGFTPVFDGSFCFWVRDNGHGLTEEEQARLFVPFTRLHQVRAQGHGLGLSIVRRIVEKLGGKVGVESHPGEGSKFWFTLPPGE